TSLSTAKTSLMSRSYVFAHKCESALASMSCTLTRTLSSAFCTLPSRTVATPSCCETVVRSSGLLLYLAVEVREITFKSAMLASLVRIHPECRRRNKLHPCRHSDFRTATPQSILLVGIPQL